MDNAINIENYRLVSYLSERRISMTEEEIIEGCKKGKRSAQSELFNRYCDAMLGVALRYSANTSEAEDALQEAFIRIYKYIPRFEGQREGSLTNWIKTIVVNTALSVNKKNKKYRFSEDIENVVIQNEVLPDEFEDNETQNKTMKALNKLPLGYKTVFSLYVLEGYSHKEIAEILSISESTSKSQLSKARKMLKKILGYNE